MSPQQDSLQRKRGTKFGVARRARCQRSLLRPAVHYENNHPFAHVTELEREIEVSHWGNVYFEERYSLVSWGGAAGLGASCARAWLEL